MACFTACPSYSTCLEKHKKMHEMVTHSTDILCCNDCINYKMYTMGFKDGAEEAIKQANKKINEALDNFIF